MVATVNPKLKYMCVCVCVSLGLKKDLCSRLVSEKKWGGEFFFFWTSIFVWSTTYSVFRSRDLIETQKSVFIFLQNLLKTLGTHPIIREGRKPKAKVFFRPRNNKLNTNYKTRTELNKKVRWLINAYAIGLSTLSTNDDSRRLQTVLFQLTALGHNS